MIQTGEQLLSLHDYDESKIKNSLTFLKSGLIKTVNTSQ